ncbi:MAG: ADOP family duplicated permease [Myxococcales bacterium]
MLPWCSAAALRGLLRRPALPLAVLLTFAIGIGASATIFAFVDGILLQPLELPEAGRLLSIEELHDRERLRRVTYATLVDLQSHRFTHLAGVAAWRSWNYALTTDARPEQVVGAMVSSDFFLVTGAAPVAGRFFDRADSSDQPLMVLSHRLWVRRFARATRVVGSTLVLGDRPYTVIGVAPPALDLPAGADVWVPLDLNGPLRGNRRSHLLDVVGRLRPGSSLQQARDELVAFSRGLAPGDDPGLTLDAAGFQDTLVAPVRPVLTLLLAAVALLLALVCFNVTGLLLARGIERQREFAIRSALGATPGELLVWSLLESLLLGSAGAALGLLLGSWGVQAVKTLVPATFPRLGEVALSGRVIAAGLAAGALASCIAAAVPALRRWKMGGFGLIRHEIGRAPARHAMRDVLTAMQICLATMLLLGAGLAARSFLKLRAVDPGFRLQGVVGFDLPLGERYGGDPALQAPLLIQMAERIRHLPGIASVGLVNGLPLTGGPSTGILISSRPDVELGAAIRIADAGYFATLGIPLLTGRLFEPTDRAGAPRAVLVSESFARNAWPGASALGERVTMKDWGEPMDATVVGVVADVRVAGLAGPVEPTLYWHLPQFPSSFNTAVVRSALPPERLLAAVEREVWQVDPTQPVARMRTLASVLADSLSRERLGMVLLAGFALAATLLAGIAIHGLLSSLVRERSREIAIRRALGARRGPAMALVLLRAGKLAFTGVAVGTAGALAASRAIRHLLYGVTPADVPTIVAVTLLIGGCAAAAAWAPARRAASIDPMIALRDE